MSHEELPADQKMKVTVEAMGAVLLLYASYSELSDKLLKTFSLDQSIYAPSVARLVACVLGLIVCGYIIVGTKTENQKVFAYSKIARILAWMFICPMLLALVMTIVELWKQQPTSLGASESYYEMPLKACERQAKNGEDEAKLRTYLCRLNIPDEYKNKFKHLKVFIAPSSGFVLKDVSPIAKENIVIEKKQEPIEEGKFEALHSEFLFPEFDSTKEWRVRVTIGTSNEQVKFSDEPPIKANIYFYKE